jgi:hypothetical protein
VHCLMRIVALCSLRVPGCSTGCPEPQQVAAVGADLSEGGRTSRLSKESCTRCAGVKPLALHHLKAAGGSASAVVWDAHKELGTLLQQVRGGQRCAPPVTLRGR